MIYYKDSDRVCFSEKFEVKVCAIQEKCLTVRYYHYDIMQAFTLHDALVFLKKMKCQPFNMSLQFSLVGVYLKAKDYRNLDKIFQLSSYF